ncbi:hypothetical protein [Sphaerisporangium dianthi]|uniref:Uncharacterized protein n=1 Tax=Sphaerisporangium dianthi TaxID=1436120 RepID=A0ABV9CDA1_9ACTN
MDRDGNPRSHDEDPLKQTGPFSIDWAAEPERPGGDVLSDGWTSGHEPVHAHGDDSAEFERPDHERSERYEGPAERTDGHDRADGPGEYTESYEASPDDYERPEGYARPDGDDWAPGGEPEGEGRRRGFLGSGWTGDSDLEEEKGSKNKGLILAMAAIVVLAVAGGWIVSSSVGSKPEAACAAPADCSPAGQKAPGGTGSPAADPTGEATGPAAVPEETEEATQAPSASPTAAPTTTSRPRATRQPTPRPSPTRTRQSSAPPTPRSSQPQQEPEDPRLEDDTPTTEPSPSPSAPPTTQAPPPQPAPTPTERNGGLLDWLF